MALAPATNISNGLQAKSGDACKLLWKQSALVALGLIRAVKADLGHRLAWTRNLGCESSDYQVRWSFHRRGGTDPLTVKRNCRDRAERESMREIRLAALAEVPRIAQGAPPPMTSPVDIGVSDSKDHLHH